jgi:hypothetical protein
MPGLQLFAQPRESICSLDSPLYLVRCHPLSPISTLLTFPSIADDIDNSDYSDNDDYIDYIANSYNRLEKLQNHRLFDTRNNKNHG